MQTVSWHKLMIRGNGLGIRNCEQSLCLCQYLDVRPFEYCNSRRYASSSSASTGRYVLSAAARPTALRLYERGSS
jgi:hypothetical protein